MNGREGLACVTRLADLDPGTVTVEPMANFPVLTDLVVDMTSFAERFPAPHPATRTSDFPRRRTVPDGIDAYERFEDCIECGLCLSACPVVATDDTYVGPAALAYAQRMLEEPRGADAARSSSGPTGTTARGDATRRSSARRHVRPTCVRRSGS